MKRLTAFALALCMLLSLAACAEKEPASAALYLSNLKIVSGDTAPDMRELALRLELDTPDGVPTLLLRAGRGSETLAMGVAQIVGNQFVGTIAGMDHAYGMEIPNVQADQMKLLPQALPTVLSALDQFRLPPITGFVVPKLDMRPLLSGFSDGEFNGITRFEIPYDAVNQALAALVEAAKAQNSEAQGLDEAAALIAKMQESRIGVTLRGTVKDSEDRQDVDGEFFLVSQGITSENALGTFTAAACENNFNAVATMILGSQRSDLASVSLVSDPAQSRIDFDLNVASVFGIAVDIYPEGDMQCTRLKAGTAAQNVSLAFDYGRKNGLDAVLFRAEASRGGSFEFSSETSMGEDGMRTGAIKLSGVQNGKPFSFAADVAMTANWQMDMGDFVMPGDVRGFDQIDGEAVNQALQLVSDYLSGKLPEPEEIPEEEIPEEDTPAEGEVPAEGAPAEETPAEEAPAEGTPAEEAPAEEAPAAEAPAEGAPAAEAPAAEAQANEAVAGEEAAESVPEAVPNAA